MKNLRAWMTRYTAMRFGVGYTWAKAIGGKPIKMGPLVAVVGVVIILVAIPLGG